MAGMDRDKAKAFGEGKAGEPGHQGLRAAAAVDIPGALARRADEVDPPHQAAPAMRLAEQHDLRHQEIEIGRAEGAGKAGRRMRTLAHFHQIDIGLAVDLAAAEEEGVDAALRGAVEELAPALPEGIEAPAAQDGGAGRTTPCAWARSARRRGQGRQRARSTTFNRDPATSRANSVIISSVRL